MDFVPVWNAYGYSYTWTNDPNWRKNRQPNKNSPCIGTDICRNFVAGWGNPDGSSANPCADDYHGASAWSAPESAILRDYAMKSLPRLKGYINFHSYAELWLTNYGYTKNLPADYNTQEATAKKLQMLLKLFMDNNMVMVQLIPRSIQLLEFHPIGHMMI